MHRTCNSGRYAEQTRGYIERTLVKTAPTVSGAARSLGMSVRTLQRRLTDENTNFSALLDDCRRVRAFESCVMGGRPPANMHEELGYAERSCLARAMRRWKAQTKRSASGRAPSASRKHR